MWVALIVIAALARLLAAGPWSAVGLVGAAGCGYFLALDLRRERGQR